MRRKVVGLGHRGESPANRCRGIYTRVVHGSLQGLGLLVTGICNGDLVFFTEDLVLALVHQMIKS